MPDKKYAIIVASPRPRTGKTLLARLLAEHFSLAGEPMVIFDTDAVERRLAAFFPKKTTVIDLDRVTDQMKLFDTLTSPQRMTQVIDLTHRSFLKFFKLMREIDYVAEAKISGITPVIFYIPDGELESYEQGMVIRDLFRECAFVLVRNEALGEPSREALRNTNIAAFALHNPRMVLPRLEPFFLTAVEDPRLSLSDFMRRSLTKDSPARLSPDHLSIAYLSLEARNAITVWLQTAFNEIRRVLKEVDLRQEILSQGRPS